MCTQGATAQRLQAQGSALLIATGQLDRGLRELQAAAQARNLLLIIRLNDVPVFQRVQLKYNAESNVLSFSLVAGSCLCLITI